MGKTRKNFILAALAEGLLLSLVTVGFLLLTGSALDYDGEWVADMDDEDVWIILLGAAALAWLLGKMRGIQNKWRIRLCLCYSAAVGLLLCILDECDSGHPLALLVCFTLFWFCLRYLHGSKDGMFAKGGKDAA